MIYLYAYLVIDAVISFILARKYWIKWRETPSKYNVYFDRKQINRMVDSYIFIVAYVGYLVLLPLALIDYVIGLIIKKKRGI